MNEEFTFNPFDEQTRRDPFPLFARARRQHPVYRHSTFPIVSVFRYADIHAILKDAETWSSRYPPRPGVDPQQLGMLGEDAPEHTRLRALVNQAFTPRIIRQLEPHLVDTVRHLLEQMLEQRDVDFIQAFASPLPVIAIAEIIGIPTADRAQFKRWSDEVVRHVGTTLFVLPTPEQAEQHQKLRAEMGVYFTELAEERRRAPREDLLTGLVHAELQGSRLSHEEMIRMLILLLVAGNETITTLLANTVLELLAHPAELVRLREDPGLVESAVDEVLRYSSPIVSVPRRATRPVQLHGQMIETGQVVFNWLGSANHDEEVFANPERFDIGRHDNPYLVFGVGPHYCLGANLARLEAQVALRALLEHTRSFARTTTEPLPLHPSVIFRGVTQLPLRLEPI